MKLRTHSARKKSWREKVETTEVEWREGEQEEEVYIPHRVRFCGITGTLVLCQPRG